MSRADTCRDAAGAEQCAACIAPAQFSGRMLWRLKCAGGEEKAI